MTSSEIDILARTLYGEARGEYGRTDGGIGALMAVASVVMNRVKAGGWFGESIKEVCLKPLQFSCWNPSDPNADMLRNQKILKGPIFKVCLQVAEEVAHGRWPDLTGGADHYHATYCQPRWSFEKEPCFRVGRHVFYKLGR